MTTPSIAGFFSGGGGKSVSWKDKPIGTTVSGVITAIQPPQPQTDPVTNEPVINKRTGQPKMQVRITLKTSERDPSDPDDDGGRNLYAGGWMIGAIGDAIRKAGVAEPQAGGTLTVRLIDRTPNDSPALAPINKFDAHYVPAPVTGGFFDAPGAPGMTPLGAQQQPVPQPSINGTGYVQPPAQAPLGAPAPAAAPPAASGPLSPEQIAAIVAGSTPAAPAPPTEPEPARPEQMNEAAWNQLDLASKKQVAATFAAMPPF